MDTIYALASAAGAAGVAVVRVSGMAAVDSLAALTPGQDAPQPRQAMLRRLVHPATGQTIDHAIVVRFAAPASFTGEDVVEYHIHGSPAVIRMLHVVLAQQNGHRLAEPGEFTRRAFEHGKMDLTEAEAVADLIHAETELQQFQAIAQMEGGLSKIYRGWADTLTRALAHLEADIDFPDEDLPGGVAAEVWPVLTTLIREIAGHLDDNRRGERLRDGIHVAVIGAPNAGKSSLVNALTQREVAIVSEHAGTTRDIIEAHLNLGGFPVILSDTAGLRPDQLSADAHGTIEGEGIRRALRRAQEADFKILLFDAVQSTPDPHTLALADDRSIIVYNKLDLMQFPSPLVREGGPGSGKMYVSTHTGEGLKELTAALVGHLNSLFGQRPSPSLTRQRHRYALADSKSSLERALSAPEPELMAEDVRLALRALGRITGRVDVEDLLDVIFRDFCIGK